MHNKDNKNYPQFPFIIIYYNVIEELKLMDVESYLLLHYLIKISKGVEIGKINMSKVEKGLHNSITRKTLSKKLKDLIKKRHIIEVEKGIYWLNADIQHRFLANGNFLIVYFEFLPILKIRLKKYLFLYLTYSLFRIKKNQNGFFDESTFCKNLKIKKSMLSKHKKDLVDLGYIMKQSGTQYKITPQIFQEFEALKDYYKKECEDDYENE